MILKVMFRDADEGEDGHGQVIDWYDELRHVAVMEGNHDERFKLSWNVIKQGTDAPVFTAFLTPRSSSGIPTLLDIRDKQLFGVWLMNDNGDTIDTLYNDW